MQIGLNNTNANASTNVDGLRAGRTPARSGALSGGASFADMLQHHAAASPAPSPAPAASAAIAAPAPPPTAQKAPEQPARPPGQGAQRLAERQSAERADDARQSQVQQQSDREDSKRAGRSSDARRSATDAAGKPAPADNSPDGATAASAASTTAAGSRTDRLKGRRRDGAEDSAASPKAGAEAVDTEAKGKSAVKADDSAAAAVTADAARTQHQVDPALAQAVCATAASNIATQSAPALAVTDAATDVPADVKTAPLATTATAATTAGAAGLLRPTTEAYAGRSGSPAPSSTVEPDEAARAKGLPADASSSDPADSATSNAAAPHEPGAARAATPIAADGSAPAKSHGSGDLPAHAKAATDVSATAPVAQGARPDGLRLDTADANRQAIDMSINKGIDMAALRAGLGGQQQGSAGNDPRGSGNGPGTQDEGASRIDGAGGFAGSLPAAMAGNFAANALAPALARSADAPAAAQLMFSTPIDAPEFAQALGVQVTTFASDGIQQAHLHLNPVETGPIAIQITIDGTQAQVDFQAASSVTRDAISAGMPELAASLHDAGFTLTGGGVSDQSHGRNEAQDAQRQRGVANAGGNGRNQDSGGGAAASAPVTTRVSQGAVDLYA